MKQGWLFTQKGTERCSPFHRQERLFCSTQRGRCIKVVTLGGSCLQQILSFLAHRIGVGLMHQIGNHFGPHFRRPALRLGSLFDVVVRRAVREIAHAKRRHYCVQPYVSAADKTVCRNLDRTEVWAKGSAETNIVDSFNKLNIGLSHNLLT